MSFLRVDKLEIVQHVLQKPRLGHNKGSPSEGGLHKRVSPTEIRMTRTSKLIPPKPKTIDRKTKISVLSVCALYTMYMIVAVFYVLRTTKVDKLEFVQHVLRISSDEGRNAEMALYRRCPDEAEAILLQASPPLIYRAIKLNVSSTATHCSLRVKLVPADFTDDIVASIPSSFAHRIISLNLFGDTRQRYCSCPRSSPNPNTTWGNSYSSGTCSNAVSYLRCSSFDGLRLRPKLDRIAKLRRHLQEASSLASLLMYQDLSMSAIQLPPLPCAHAPFSPS